MTLLIELRAGHVREYLYSYSVTVVGLPGAERFCMFAAQNAIAKRHAPHCISTELVKILSKQYEHIASARIMLTAFVFCGCCKVQTVLCTSKLHGNAAHGVILQLK